MNDPSEFIQCLAARALLMDFDRISAMDSLIDHMGWGVWPLKEQWLYGFLMDLTGQSFPPKREPWENWWKETKTGFDLQAHTGSYAQIVEAGNLTSEGKESEAADLYCEILVKIPDHAGASKELSDILNGQIEQADNTIDRAIEMVAEKDRAPYQNRKKSSAAVT